MMKPFSLLAAALVLAGATWIPACSDSDSETPAPDASSQGFRGVLVAADGTDGVFELRPTGDTRQALRTAATAPITLSGTVTLGNGLTAQVTGSYDPSTGTVTASGTVQLGGGTIAFQARYANGRLDGTWTGPNGLGGSLSGLGIALGPITLYCGPFVGARQGRLTLAVSGSLAGGAAVFAGNQALLLTGSATPSNVDLSFANSGRATGTIAGPNVTGNWNDAAGSGTFAASSAGCPVLGVPGAVDAGTIQDSGTDAPVGDSGALPAAELLQESEPISDIVVAGEYVGYTFGSSKAISWVKRDGTGRDKTADVCNPFCSVPVVQGSSILFLDNLTVKKVTPPSKTVTTVGTVPEAMLYGRANDRYVWYSSQTAASGGFYRFDTQQTNSSSNLGLRLANLDLFDSVLYYTDMSVSNQDAAFKRFEGTFQSEPSTLVARANVTDTVYGGVASEAAGSVFLTTQQPADSLTLHWVDHVNAGAVKITTIPRNEVGVGGIASVARVRMDATNVFVQENAAGSVQAGRMLYVAKSTRNGTGATQLVAFSDSKVRGFALDATSVFIGLQNGKLMRQPKP